MLPVTTLIKQYKPVNMSEGAWALQVSSVVTDSRQVTAGALFVAIAGAKVSGASFIPDAVAKGAGIIVCQPEDVAAVPEGVAFLEVENARLALAKYAAAFYAPQPSRIVAVTGTDGKSSTVEFTRQLWEKMGRASATIGTLGVRSAHPIPPLPIQHTTPDAVTLHRQLQLCSHNNIQRAAIETSSHGLDQYRADGVILDAAAFTTFGVDHRDYHPTIEDYFRAKARLFTEVLSGGGWAILNADDPAIAPLGMFCLTRGQVLLTFGKNGKALQLVEAKPVPEGLDTSLVIEGKPWRGIIPLYGAFQVMNVLAACGLVFPDAAGTDALLYHLPDMQGVPGRLEKVGTHPSGAPIFVDYAHTPQALKHILTALRLHTTGKLAVVFGCGGDRDAAKRPEMGRIAATLADTIIVTDDNPRSENPATIRAQILAECPGAAEEGDRSAAISRALEGLKAGDVLVVAGKGHETTQTIGTQLLHHNDAEVIRSLLGQEAKQRA